ncbi:P-loop containing nucleoside triphosphate hydrolase protein [Lentinula aciculospora]|uniref:P-loop containing nucleoside triphosphate hydrolase protein n=1 Tax=Lentinula aciculospora TaxID=153920 RepID=A0A9W9AEB8_9AGAR|nr:P-loop containing nucleoside triphosphate hydrolase protein [Lentinula aciculospora]
MESSSSTHTSLLGKRSRQPDQNVEQLQTPGPTPNPKRAKVTTPVLDGDGNKENIPPLSLTPINNASASPSMSNRAVRALRRSTTSESFVTPPARTAIKRNASFSTSFAHLTLATPPATPLTLLPLHVRVRALLRATSDNNFSMPARDNEREIITRFITNFLSHSVRDTFHSFYISGSPGCGKTALMNTILKNLESDGIRIINVNCVALTSVDALWNRLVDEFDGVFQKKRKSGMKKGNGREAVESLLRGMTIRCILVLDEMDHIASDPQSISSLLNLTRSDKLCVIGIANTHTLTSSPSNTPDDIQTLHFSPYTSMQLLQILQSRLGTLTSSAQPSSESATDANISQFLPLPALTLLTKKIAALTGDVRTLFEVLRGAIDLAVTSSVTAKIDDENFFAKPSPVYSITPAHILAAMKTVFQSRVSQTSGQSTFMASAPTTSNSGIVQKITCLGLQARLVLLSILVAVKRIEAGLTIDFSSGRISSAASNVSRQSSSSSSVADRNIVVDGSHLHAYYSHILRRGAEGNISTPVSRTEFSDLLGMLEGVGLVALGSSQMSPKKKKQCFGKSVSFRKTGASPRHSGTLTEEVRLAPGIWVDEVLRGLGVSCLSNANASRDVKEEELNAIWMKEDAVIRKELKVIENRRNSDSDGHHLFVDASLDD